MSISATVDHSVYKSGATQVSLLAELKTRRRAENKTSLSGLVFFLELGKEVSVL